MATGDELVTVDQKPSEGKIRNGNGPMLCAMARSHRCDAQNLGIVKDNAADLRQRIKQALAHAVVSDVNFEPYPSTRGLLDDIQQRGLPMALLTDAWPSVRPKFAALGFLEYFASFVISAEEGCTKPHIGMFRPALDALGVLPEEVVFIDDGADIVAGAKALGLQAHQINLDGNDAPITSHAQILDLLD